MSKVKEKKNEVKKIFFSRISLPVPPKGPEPVCEVLVHLVTLIFIVFTLLFPRNMSKCCYLLHLLLGF